jgi:hypothetical protein
VMLKLNREQVEFLTQAVAMYITAPEPDIIHGHIKASRVFAALGWAWMGRDRADALTVELLRARFLDASTRTRVSEVFVVPSAAGIAQVRRTMPGLAGTAAGAH